jgi:hypothetical protein
MRKIILLGAKGALGAQVASLLDEENISYRSVTRDATDCDGLHWDYVGSVPSEMANASCIIHCARGPEFNSNVAAVAALLRDASAETKIILMGSNCVFATPKNTLSRIFFAGDAYILEKKKIEKLAKTRPNTIVLRPTVVRDEGGWKTFLRGIKSADTVRLPRGSKDSRIKIIDSVDVAHEILKHVFSSNSEPISDELYSDIVPLSEFLRSKGVVYGLSDNTYFDGFLKNAIVSFLCSVFIPFRVKAFVQQQFIKPKEPVVNQGGGELCVDGMTRLYLCGGHTKK